MTERENVLHVLRHDGQAKWVPVVSRAVCIPQVRLNRDKVTEGQDWFGVTWRESTPVSPPLFDDVTQWREYVKFPDQDSLDWRGEADRLRPSIDRENKAVWMMMSQGLFERMHSLMGFENALVSFYEAPEETAALIAALAEFRYRLTEKLLEWFDPDIINYRDDYGSQQNLLFSPEIFRTFFRPHLERLARQAHERGKLFVLHSCGKVDALIGDFVALGADAWDSVQPCCDLKGICENYGHTLAFSSSLDLQAFTTCTPQQARQIVRDTIDLLGRHRSLMIWDVFPLELPLDSGVITDEVIKYGKFQ